MVTYDGNVVLLDNGLCLWHNARESAEICGTDNLANIMDHIGETYHL